MDASGKFIIGERLGVPGGPMTNIKNLKFERSLYTKAETYNI